MPIREQFCGRLPEATRLTEAEAAFRALMKLSRGTEAEKQFESLVDAGELARRPRSRVTPGPLGRITTPRQDRLVLTTLTAAIG